MNFPSQKLFYFFIPVIVVLAGFVLIKNNISAKDSNEIGGLTVVEDKAATLPEPDTDDDGLKDWEEIVFGTDPNTADSDNDGVSDKSEYEESKKSPITDKLFSNKVQGNLTQSASIELFTQYASLKQSDSFNATNVDLLADRVVSELQAAVPKKTYTSGELTIIKEATENSIRAYGNALAGIRNTYFEEYKKDPVESPKGSWLNDPIFVAGMKRASGIYLKMSEDLMTLSVPYEIAGAHLELANNYLNSSIALNETIGSSDPLKSATSLGVYINLQAEEFETLAKVASYLRQSDIIFTTDESGSFWNTQ